MRYARWLILGTMLPAPARADESPLARVPAQAVAVFHLRGSQGAQDRLLALLRKALPEEAARKATALLEKARGGLLDGRRLKGLPPDGPAFLAFLEAPLERPAFIVRVTDYAGFRDGLLTAEERKSLRRQPAGYEAATVRGGPAEVFFAHHRGYAVLAPDKETVLELTKGQPGLDGKLTAADA